MDIFYEVIEEFTSKAGPFPPMLITTKSERQAD
jgi:hypothetical protein